MYLRRVRVDGLSFAAAPTHVQQPLRRQRLRHKTSAWASSGPAGGRHLAGEEQLGRCSTGQSKYCRLYLLSSKLTLAAMYLRRVRVVGRGFVVGAPPLTNFQPLLRRLRLRHENSALASVSIAGGRRVAACLGRWRALPRRNPPRHRTAQRPHFARSAPFLK